MDAENEGRALPGFGARIPPRMFDEVERGAAVACAVDAALRLAYFNPAFLRFSRENDGPGDREWRARLGMPILEVVPPALRDFYARLYASVLGGRAWRSPIGHLYECSSPNVFRQFHAAYYALPGDAGVLAVHALVVSRIHEPSGAGVTRLAALRHGRQCANCRRTYDGRTRSWVWVPALVERPPRDLVHVVCGPCARHYYPGVEAFAD